MNKLVQIRAKIKRAERLHQAQLLATENGEITPYKRSSYQERVKQAQKDLEKSDY